MYAVQEDSERTLQCPIERLRCGLSILQTNETLNIPATITTYTCGQVAGVALWLVIRLPRGIQ